MAHPFGYQMEKFDQARSALLAPHPHGEVEAFAAAFEFCSRGLLDLDPTALDEEVCHLLDVITSTLNTSGLEDSRDVGLYHIRAETLSTSERLAFSRAVDHLASWFAMEFWSSGK